MVYIFYLVFLITHVSSNTYAVLFLGLAVVLSIVLSLYEIAYMILAPRYYFKLPINYVDILRGVVCVLYAIVYNDEEEDDF